jgi:hypothetical protein
MLRYHTPRNHSAANRDARQQIAAIDAAIDAMEIHAAYNADLRAIERIRAQRNRAEESRRLLSRYRENVQ